MYSLYLDSHVQRDDGLIIPPDPDNTDWQAYQVWLADGNTTAALPVAAPSIEITAAAFLARFTDAERLAIQQAADATPSIALGLTMGLAIGTIRLQGDPVMAGWMAALVTAGAVTQDRATEILTP